MTLGSDGNVWFVEQRAGQIGRITPAGVITEFPVAGVQLSEITAGQPGTLWFTYSIIDNPSNLVGRITTDGQVTTFSTPAGGCPTGGIALGSDGNVWFTDLCRASVDRIDPSGVVTEFPVPEPNGGPDELAAGPDGNIWYTDPGESDHGLVGRVTMSGVITLFAFPRGIFPGPIIAGDRFLYAAESNALYRISTQGVVRGFAVPTMTAISTLAFFPPRTIWMTGFNGIGSFDVRTHIATPAIQVPRNGRAGCCAEGIVEGPDHDPWFGTSNLNYIGVFK